MRNKIISLFFLFILLFSICAVYTPSVGATWWDASYNFLKNCYVSNPYLKYQMKIVVGKTAGSGNNVTCGGHCQDDFSDIRFISQNTTPIPYWIQNYTSGVEATIWINNTYNETCFQMYYGKGAVSTTSDGNTTFDFFDNFNGTSMNTHKWITTGTPTLTYSNSILTIDATTNGKYITASGELRTATFGKGYQVVVKRFDVNGYRPIGSGFGLVTSSNPWPPAAGIMSNGAQIIETSWEDGVSFVDAGDNHNRISAYYIYSVIRSSESSPHIYSYFNYTTTSYAGGSSTNIPSQSISPAIGEQNGAVEEKAYFDWIFVSKFRMHSQSCSPTWKSFGGEQMTNYIFQSSPIPSNGATLILRHPIVSITVSNTLGHTMNLDFKTNLSGSYASFGTNLTVTNGTYKQHFYGAVLYKHKYWWSVNATDSTVFHVWTNISYSFTTIQDYPPTITISIPVNESCSAVTHTHIGEYVSQPPISITVSDPEGDLMNVSYKCNSSGTYTKIGGRSAMVNGSYSNTSTSFSLMNHTYWESVNFTDNHSNWHNFSVNFYMLFSSSSAITINNYTANVMHGYTTSYSSSTGWTVNLYYTNYPITLHNYTTRVVNSNHLHFTPNGYDEFDNDSSNININYNLVNVTGGTSFVWDGSEYQVYVVYNGVTTPIHITNSTDHAIPLHYIVFNSTGWWITDADFCHAGYTPILVNCTGSTYFTFIPGYGYSFVDSYTGTTTPMHIQNITQNVTKNVVVSFNSTGWWVMNKDTGNITSLTWANNHYRDVWSHLARLLPNDSWYIFDNDTGNVTGIMWINSHVNDTWSHNWILLGNNTWELIDSDLGNLTPMHLKNTSSGVTGYIAQSQNSTGYWINVHLIGAGGGPSVVYKVKINLSNIMNFKNWSGSIVSSNENISFNVTHNMTLVCNGNSTITISFSVQIIGMFVLLIMTLFFLYMGYSMSDRKQGAWFLIFGGLILLSLIMAILSFAGVWWFVSPVFILFFVIVMRDGIMLLLYGKKYRRK